MLDVDSAGAGAGEITHELFERGRTLSRIAAENLEERFRLRPQSRSRDLSSVLLRLFREEDAPGRRYQPGFSEAFESGVFRPLRIESRIRGIETR